MNVVSKWTKRPDLFARRSEQKEKTRFNFSIPSNVENKRMRFLATIFKGRRYRRYDKSHDLL